LTLCGISDRPLSADYTAEETLDSDFPSAENHTMLYTAYFDASTTQKGRQFVSVSGCLAPAARWKTFESKWQKMLNKEGLPYFHMTDFEAYQGHYRDWTRHNHLFKKIARAITGKAKFAFGRGVAHDDFGWAKSQNAKLKDFSPFTYCASQCLHAVAEWATRHRYNDPIVYIFEKGDGSEGELLELKTLIESSSQRKNRYRWGELYILPKVMNNPPYPLTPLQAADVWAFEARKEWENFHSTGKRTRAVRKSARALLGKGVEIDFGFSEREKLLTLPSYWEADLNGSIP